MNAFILSASIWPKTKRQMTYTWTHVYVIVLQPTWTCPRWYVLIVFCCFCVQNAFKCLTYTICLFPCDFLKIECRFEVSVKLVISALSAKNLNVCIICVCVYHIKMIDVRRLSLMRTSQVNSLRNDAPSHSCLSRNYVAVLVLRIWYTHLHNTSFE